MVAPVENQPTYCEREEKERKGSEGTGRASGMGLRELRQ
eukprot:CAMPEP_0119477558 /NCGR_PEP_ID=MMETSP1344-20130328/7658_1 /TAXON_ID=236787 /ORGANISM="Florenciella parvula, Strain CCMP2471" /LENGTH=38 /DNA_ID= /DNA_START= /DNA_END= /DNA_ORIENTATION=